MSTQDQTQTWGQLLELLNTINDQEMTTIRTINMDDMDYFSKAETEPGGGTLGDFAFPSEVETQTWQGLKGLLLSMPPGFMDQVRTIHSNGQSYIAVAKKADNKVNDAGKRPD